MISEREKGIGEGISQFKRNIITHSSFSNSNRHGEFRLLKILISTNIDKTSMELFQSPPKTFYVTFKMPCSALNRLVKSVKEKFKWVHTVYDVESFFWRLWNSSMEFLVILVRIRIFFSPNSSCLNYY